MSQPIVRRLLAAGAVAAVFAAGPVQAQEGPRSIGTLWRWLGSFQEPAAFALRLWGGEAAAPRKAGPRVSPEGISGKQGLMIDPDGYTAPTAPSCQTCPEQGHMIDPDG